MSNLFEKNLYLLEETYKKRIPYLQSYPTMLTIPVSDTCNLKCFYCGPGVHPEKYTLKISQEAYERCQALFPYLEKIELEGTELFNTGKETIADWFCEQTLPYDQLKLYGATNGILIDDRRAEALVKKFGAISFTIDSCNPELYAKIKVGGELTVLEANIKKINDIKAKNGLAPHDPPLLQFAAVIMRSTFRDLPKLVQWVSDRGGVFLSLRPLAQDLEEKEWEPIRLAEDIFVYEKEIKELHHSIEEAKKLGKRLGVTIYDLIYRKIRQIQFEHDMIDDPVVETPSPDLYPGICNYGWKGFYVLSNGVVSFHHCSRRILGNLNDQDVREIWNSPAAKEERINFLKYHYVHCSLVCEKGYGDDYKPPHRKEGFWEKIKRRRQKSGRYQGILP
ncbi:MAG: SPASM domain-containing protein [bacterium]